MRVIFSVWAASFREVFAKRRAFYIDVSIMIINDLTWIVLWTFLFNNTGSIRGWDIDRIYILFSVIAVSFGISFGLFRNTRRISEIVNDGSLDAALTLPVDTLTYLLVRRVSAPVVGDIVFGLGLFFIVVQPTLVQSLIFIVVSILGAMVMASFLVLLGSLTLHFGGKGEQADLGFEAINIFSFYPIDMFGGPTKVMLFTVLPGAFVTAVPAELIEHFTLVSIGWLLLAAAVFATAARVTFTTGLRKYRSGSRWTTA
jgi:ABC-2 type transport system permease protein